MLQKFEHYFGLEHAYLRICIYADSDRAADLLLDAAEEELETIAADTPKKVGLLVTRKRLRDTMIQGRSQGGNCPDYFAP